MAMSAWLFDLDVQASNDSNVTFEFGNDLIVLTSIPLPRLTTFDFCSSRLSRMNKESLRPTRELTSFSNHRHGLNQTSLYHYQFICRVTWFYILYIYFDIVNTICDYESNQSKSWPNILTIGGIIIDRGNAGKRKKSSLVFCLSYLPLYYCNMTTFDV